MCQMDLSPRVCNGKGHTSYSDISSPSLNWNFFIHVYLLNFSMTSSAILKAKVTLTTLQAYPVHVKAIQEY